jgi:hypothetical protein
MKTATTSTVIGSAAAAQFEFADFPAPQATADESPWACYRRLSLEFGGLIPQTMLPLALGVSTARVCQLMNDGHFQVVKIGGTNYVGGEAFERFLMQERKAGRPVKKPSKLALVKGVVSTAKEKLRKT